MFLLLLLLMTLLTTHQAATILVPLDSDLSEEIRLEPYERSANDFLFGLLRSKRSPLYHVLESPGLHSHFQTDLSTHNAIPRKTVLDSKLEKIISTRLRRDIGDDIIPEQKDASKTRLSEALEELTDLPKPEKQVVDPEYYRKKNWNTQSFNSEYSKVNEEEDSLPEASINEGIQGRQPRVNFITQQKRNNNNKEENKDKQVVSKLTRPSNYQQADRRLPETYPSQSYDPYLRRYDRFDDEYNRYDPYYEDYYLNRRRYDPYDSYSPHTPAYPEPYYNYPDHRYDIPDPRYYRPMYSNDIYDRPLQYAVPDNHDNHGHHNHRIIYYAHLPEVIRAPPSVDLTYRHGRDRYDSSYGQPMPSGNYQMDAYNNANSEFVKREKKDHRSFGHNSKTIAHMAPGRN